MTEDTNAANPGDQNSPTISTATAGKHTDDGDIELKAINAVVTALSSLTVEQRLRALDYVLRRFNVAAPQTSAPVTVPQVLPSPVPSLAHPIIQPHPSASGAIHDIRTLKETKSPKSAIEMATLVAYFVSELALEGEQKNEITKPDLERYFKMAGFKLPPDASATLVNAKNAGYLDSAGTGLYKLNPVGYNLVAHRMGNRDAGKKERGGGRKAGAKRRPLPAKKTPLQVKKTSRAKK